MVVPTLAGVKLASPYVGCTAVSPLSKKAEILGFCKKQWLFQSIVIYDIKLEVFPNLHKTFGVTFPGSQCKHRTNEGQNP